LFYFIKGIAAAIEPSLVVIDAGGVGYGINTSLNSSCSVKMGQEVTFYTYLHVREDIFELYGFITRAELNCFKQLIGVSGVGPKAALAILGTVTPERLSLCIISGDEKALCAAPGVGKKLAQRIILELKDKMNATSSDIAAGISEVSAGVGAGNAASDAIDALVALGYSRAAAMNALKGTENSGMGTEELIRAALKKLF